MTCINSLHCNIYGNMDSSNLRFLGFTTKTHTLPPDHLLSLPGDATMVEIEATDLPPNRLHDKQRQAEAKARQREDNDNDNKLYTVLDFYPNRGQSYFFTFVVSGKELDKISMDLYEPIQMDSLSPNCVALLSSSSVNGRCVTGTVDGAIVEWDVTNQEVVGYYSDRNIGSRTERRPSKRRGSTVRLAHEGSISCLSVADNEDLMASGGLEGVVKIWSISKRKLLRAVTLHTSMVSSVTNTKSL